MDHQLSNFYTENTYSESDFIIIADAVKEAYDEFVLYTDQIVRNFIIGQTETYRHLFAQDIPLAGSTYDLGVILVNTEVENELGISDLTLEDKIAFWDSLNPNDERKIKALDIFGAYADLNAVLVYPFSGLPRTPKRTVICMDLYLLGEKLQIGVDFEVFKNRLYILNSKIAKPSNSESIFAARDIYIDYDTVYRHIGSNFDLPKYDDMPKDVINYILEKITASALEGPTIKGLKHGVEAITGVANPNGAYDKYSAPKNRRNLWNDYNMTPFDFVIEIPAELSTSATMTDIVRRYVNKVKLADTDFDIILNSIYEELYSRHVKASSESSDIIHDTYSEIYERRYIYAQTNIVERKLNKNFTTEHVLGISQSEDARSVITNVTTGEITVVDY